MVMSEWPSNSRTLFRSVPCCTRRLVKWHVQSGTSLQELMELGGRMSDEIVLRYAHLTPEKLKSVAQRIEWHPSADALVSQKNVANPLPFRYARCIEFV